MIGMSNDAKERYMRGEYQYARLTMERSPYEPYKGEVFSTQLSVEGENIFTRENETENSYINSSGNISTSSNYCLSDYIEVEECKRYVFDASMVNLTSGVYHAFYDDEKTRLAITSATQEGFIPPTGAKYVRLSYRKDANATDFHISIGTVPHGTLDVKTGILTVDYAFLSDLSIYFFSRVSATYTYIFVSMPMSNMKVPTESSGRLEGIASSGYRISNTDGVNASMTHYSMLRNNGRLYFRNDDYNDDAVSFRASLSGQQAIYELASPCVYQLTPEEVTTLLNENNIWADSGDVSVTYRTTAGTQKTESGSLVHITDGANNIPVISLTADVNYTQDLHGYDYPWVSGGAPNPSAPETNICPIVGREEVKVTRAGGNTYNAANLVLSAGSGIEVIDANTIQVDGTTGQENRNVYPLIKGTAKTLKFDSAAIMSVGTGETYHIYERVNGVLNSIATVEQTSSTEKVTAYVSADADALVIGGWSGYTVSEFRKIRLATGTIPEPLVITNSDIVDGGYSVNRYVVTGDSLQFGSCVSGELTLILDNHDGKFDNESFMSKEIHAEVGMLCNNNIMQYASLGWFTVDESPKKLSKITLSALDRMMKFEKKVDPTLLSFPITLYELLQRICEICGVVLRTGSYNFFNADYNVMEFPSIAQTYRDILSYICEINGSCAYMDINGELVLGWFSSTPAATLDTSNRFDSDIDEHAVIIYGVSVITETENFHAGTVGFDIQVGHNPLITYDEQAIADSLFAKVGGFTYYPFTANTMPMPFFEPMDGATFIDKEGNSHFVAITDVTFRLNRNTALSGKGQTIRETDYERKYGVSATYANVDEALEIIKNTIIKNAEIVTQQMQEIVTSYTGLYEAISSEFGSYRQETDAKITQNAEGLTQAYTNIQQIDSKYGIALTDTNEAIVQLADGAVATNTNFRSVTEAYIKSGLLFYEGLDPVYGVAVGQLTYEVINGEKLIKRKGVYSVFTAEELAFYVDDVKVAYFRNNKLYISNAEFLSAVRIGDYTLSVNGNGFTIR